MSRKNKYSDELFENIVDLVKRIRLPIFTLDKKWLVLFDGDRKTKEITKLEEKVNKLLKSQGSVNSQREDLIKLKKKLMKGIVTNMDATNNKRVQMKMEKSRDLINDINDKLILLEDEELSLPNELREANAELGVESLKVMIEHIDENDEEIKELDEWIEATREELKEKVALRHDKALVNDKMKEYMYKTFGDEIVSMYKEYMEE